MRILFSIIIALLFISCWDSYKGRYLVDPPVQEIKKVWGNKPIYGSETNAKKIIYSSTPEQVSRAGNIYIKGKYLFQVEVGKGIHVIDNSDPTTAKRIGFLTINGSSEISIRGNHLFSNSYEDLVVIDLSNPDNIREISRVKNAFPENRYYYPYAAPSETGYYECPFYDSIVVGWKKDSILASCYKN